MSALSRRRLVTLGAAAWLAPGAFAEELARTARQPEGPFYPDRLPLDTDNDLLIVNDGITPAVGIVAHLTGRILDTRGEPVREAVIEIWQADSHGLYLHTRSGDQSQRDAHFQGYGRFLTGASGEYYFRTIKPVAYTGRTPHIHVRVKQGGKERLTTECYIRGEPKNATDAILNGIRDERARAALLVPFTPVAGSQAGEVAARFEIVLGITPERPAA